jgi:hypothetical protein
MTGLVAAFDDDDPAGARVVGASVGGSVGEVVVGASVGAVVAGAPAATTRPGPAGDVVVTTAVPRPARPRAVRIVARRRGGVTVGSFLGSPVGPTTRG